MLFTDSGLRDAHVHEPQPVFDDGVLTRFASSSVEAESNDQCIANTIPASARPSNWRASRILLIRAKE